MTDAIHNLFYSNNPDIYQVALDYCLERGIFMPSYVPIIAEYRAFNLNGLTYRKSRSGDPNSSASHVMSVLVTIEHIQIPTPPVPIYGLLRQPMIGIPGLVGM